MIASAPHFLLYAEAAQASAGSDSDACRWRFMLRQPSGETEFEAADDEPSASAERLELLAVVRGLEALPQPSRVTLVAGSRYLRRGLESGLAYWKENDWQWERYGRMTPIKNGDLWRRLDRLSEIHRLDFPPARLEGADDLAPPPAAVRRTIGGKRIRIDQAGHGVGPRISESKSTSRRPTPSAEYRVRKASSLALSWLYTVRRGLLLVLRPVHFIIQYLLLRGEDNRAHYRLARRHERPARRSTRTARRRPRAADDSPRGP